MAALAGRYFKSCDKYTFACGMVILKELSTVSLDWDKLYREMLATVGISYVEIDDYGCTQIDGKNIDSWQPLDKALSEAMEQFKQR